MIQGKDKIYLAVVQEIDSGRYGRYAIARSDELEGSITFSLSDKSVWEEEAEPEPGSRVELTDVRSMAGGWRAHKAKFVRPT